MNFKNPWSSEFSKIFMGFWVFDGFTMGDGFRMFDRGWILALGSDYLKYQFFLGKMGIKNYSGKIDPL